METPRPSLSEVASLAFVKAQDVSRMLALETLHFGQEASGIVVGLRNNRFMRKANTALYAAASKLPLFAATVAQALGDAAHLSFEAIENAFNAIRTEASHRAEVPAVTDVSPELSLPFNVCVAPKVNDLLIQDRAEFENSLFDISRQAIPDLRSPVDIAFAHQMKMVEKEAAVHNLRFEGFDKDGYVLSHNVNRIDEIASLFDDATNASVLSERILAFSNNADPQPPRADQVSYRLAPPEPTGALKPVTLDHN